MATLNPDRTLAAHYVKAAIAALDDPQDRGACFKALRTVAEAYMGEDSVFAQECRRQAEAVAARDPAGAELIAFISKRQDWPEA